MYNSRLKIAVIGAGIIGLYMALKLSQKGHEVTVFEKKSRNDVGHKCCSTLVSERIKHFIPISENYIENVIDSCIIHFPQKDVRLNFNPKHLVLNRTGIINELIRMNEVSGVKIIFNSDIKELPKGYDRIIGCDGALSITRRLLNLPNPIMKSGLQFFLDKENHSNTTETYLSKTGFCWQIPKGNEIEYGIMGDSNSVKEELNNQFNLDNAKISAALIPGPRFSFFDSGLIMPKIEDVTLCGDAMGLTKPWSGGGIIWGLYAADILVKTFPDFNEYNKEINRFFGYKIKRGIVANRLVHFLGKNFSFIIPSTINYDNDFPSFLIAFKGYKW